MLAIKDQPPANRDELREVMSSKHETDFCRPADRACHATELYSIKKELFVLGNLDTMPNNYRLVCLSDLHIQSVFEYGIH